MTEGALGEAHIEAHVAASADARPSGNVRAVVVEVPKQHAMGGAAGCEAGVEERADSDLLLTAANTDLGMKGAKKNYKAVVAEVLLRESEVPQFGATTDIPTLACP